MSLTTDYINNAYMPEVAESLNSMLLAMYQLQDDFKGEETLEGMITQNEGTEIDIYDWVRNRIVAECKIVMETYGIKVTHDAPISVIVGCLAPLVRLKKPEDLGIFEKFIESQHDAETVYSLMIGEVWELDLHPLIYLEDVRPSLIKLLAEHTVEDIATLDSTQRAVLLAFKHLHPKNKIINILLSTFTDVDGDFREFVTVYGLDKKLENKATKPIKYLVDLLAIGLYIHGDIWEAEADVREYLNDTWGSESPLFTFSSMLNNIINDLDNNFTGDRDEVIPRED